MESTEDLNEKEKFLLELLKLSPALPMKEANVDLRERFGTGVSGPAYAKVKRLLEQDAEAEAPQVRSSESDRGGDEPKSRQDDRQEFTEDAEGEDDRRGSRDSRDSRDSYRDHGDTPENTEPEQTKAPAVLHDVHLEVHLQGTATAKSVHLAGSFNEWKHTELPMTRGRENHHWIFDGKLPEGEHTYRFVVDSKFWELDLERERVTDRSGVAHRIVIPH